MKLETIKKKLQAAGLEVTDIVLNIKGAEAQGLKVNTDYGGPYPTKETFQKLETVRKIVKNGYKVEPRGYYTAVFIY